MARKRSSGKFSNNDFGGTGGSNALKAALPPLRCSACCSISEKSFMTG